MADHYEVLGVGRGASTEQIRQAYVRLAKANHPDRRQHDDAGRRARADAAMKAANAAWSTLRDPGRRAAYDLTLRDAADPRRTGAPTGARPAGTPGRPPPPTSGIVVPAAHAPFLRYLPIVVIVVVLVGVLVFSAIETSKDSVEPSGPPTTEPRFAVGSCLLVAALDTGPAPVPVGCGTQGAAQVASVVATPRPCPPDTVGLELGDNRTTLCLRSPR